MATRSERGGRTTGLFELGFGGGTDLTRWTGIHPSLPVRCNHCDQNATLNDALASRQRGMHDTTIMSSLPTQFADVTVVTKANVYFDGNGVSHTVLFRDDTKKTLGLIRPGSYHFNTGAPERMEIIAGDCQVALDGAKDTRGYAAGTFFDVPGNSGFTITVKSGLCEYICSFLKA
jgi:purine/pyrimidine-nucleoside phosphorylase